METVERKAVVMAAATETRKYPKWVKFVEIYTCTWRYCDHTRDVWRRADARKSFGHKKYIYCTHCVAFTAHEKTEEFSVN